MALIRTYEELISFLQSQGIDPDLAGVQHLASFSHPFPLRLTTHYAQRIDWLEPNDPLKRIVIPDTAELMVDVSDFTDPIGDAHREAVPGLIHRYPDRALLLLTMHCRIHCRFCFRREVVGRVRPVNFLAIKSYLQENPSIQEIILSGGDPGTFPPAFLQSLQHHLLDISSIRVWRWHTRVPVVDPESLQEEYFQAVKSVKDAGRSVYIVVHIDHAQEWTPATAEVIRQLHQTGATVLSQTVLLRGVNDTVTDLEDLFRTLVAGGVKPYYLHHPDKVAGAHHFRLSICEGRQLYRQLRGRLSGIAIPEYMLDLPGGMGKVTVESLQEIEPGRYRASAFHGQVEYVDDVEVEASNNFYLYQEKAS